MTDTAPLILASQSSYRAAVMRNAGLDFETASDRAPETCPALKLMHQLTGAAQMVPPVLPVLLLHALTGAPASQPYPYRPPHARTYPSRAPPTV